MNYKILPLAFLAAVILVAGCTATSNTANDQNTISENQNTVNVKEFYTDSFYTVENGTTYPQYSLKEITVNEGDKVVIYVNVTKGTHDFNIDEFGVSAATPTGQVTKIEFTADKSGEFIYYCSMPDHRAKGHWGTLKVL
ncbi:MAG TPA: cupredoxin domain-containing protein [archaeon]|nr:cupredoxin domain-containing protein [archaeon]